VELREHLYPDVLVREFQLKDMDLRVLMVAGMLKALLMLFRAKFCRQLL
jgi:hypothetical protein